MPRVSQHVRSTSSLKPKPGICSEEHRLSAPPSLTQKPIQCAEQPLREPESPSEAAAKAQDGHRGETRVDFGCFVPLGHRGSLLLQNPRRWPCQPGSHTGLLSLTMALGFTDTVAYWFDGAAFCVQGSIPGEFTVQRAPAHLSSVTSTSCFLHQEAAAFVLITVLFKCGYHPRTAFSELVISADSLKPHGRTIESERQGKTLEIYKSVP